MENGKTYTVTGYAQFVKYKRTLSHSSSTKAETRYPKLTPVPRRKNKEEIRHSKLTQRTSITISIGAIVLKYGKSSGQSNPKKDKDAARSRKRLLSQDWIIKK